MPLVLDCDVAILGLGPVGATLANQLGAAGLDVVVVERDTGVYPLPRAIHFDGEVMRVFQSLGLRAEVEAISRPGLKGMHFVNADDRVLMVRGGTAAEGPQGCANNHYFHQPELEAVLRRGLARWPNVRVLLGREVEAIDASADGVRLAVLTPHVFPGRWDNDCDTLAPVFDRFRRAVDDAGIPLALRLGAELHLSPESLAMVEAGRVPALGHWDGRPVVLLELPDGGIPVGAMKAVERLHRLGAVTMLAHPERNKDVMRATARLVPFVEAGCLLQLTAASVCGRFGGPAHRTALEILDAGWAAAVATDAHHLVHRPPVLADARRVLRARYGDEIALRLTEATPSRIVASPSPERPSPDRRIG